MGVELSYWLGVWHFLGYFDVGVLSLDGIYDGNLKIIEKMHVLFILLIYCL